MAQTPRARQLIGGAYIALILVVGLSGCDHEAGLGQESLLTTLSDAEARNPITVVEQTPRLEIPVSSPGSDLAGSARLETARFLHQYQRVGGGKLHVSVPPGSGGSTAATIQDVRLMIRQAGIAHGAVVFTHHGANDRNVRLSYTRVAAVSAPCGDWSENADLNRDNLPYKNFGCAVQNNMAAMIARPTDVLYPTPETPRGTERRTTDQKKHGDAILGADTKTGISTSTR